MFYTLANLKTPCLLVDKEKMKNNIARVQAYGNNNHILVRPHCKTHKSSFVGKKQLEAGAAGISVATLGEAEIFSRENFSSIFITRQISEENKFDLLFSLSRKGQIILSIDNLEVAKKTGDYFHQHKMQVSIRLEIDSGHHRCGVLPEKAFSMAEKIWQMDGLSLDGIFTHAGQVYGAKPEKVESVAKDEAQALVDVYQQLKKAGIPCKTRSTGTTPTFPFTHKFPEINEIRPGVYVYYDRMQAYFKSCTEEEIALHVLATVVSRPAKNRCVINAGSKALGLDTGVHGKQILKGFGHIHEFKAEITALSEEHGIVTIPEDSPLRPGDNLVITPNHVCSVTNLFDFFWLINGRYVERQIPIDARGRNW